MNLLISAKIACRPLQSLQQSKKCLIKISDISNNNFKLTTTTITSESKEFIKITISERNNHVSSRRLEMLG